MSIAPKLKLCAGPCNSLKVIWKQFEGNRYCAQCWGKLKPTTSIQRSTISKTQKPIAKESSKRKKEHVLYSIMRIQYLNDHPVCFMNISGLCTKQATEIQHLKGRGKYYLDMTFWGGACHNCHAYATDHPSEAIENGWALLRITK